MMDGRRMPRAALGQLFAGVRGAELAALVALVQSVRPARALRRSAAAVHSELTTLLPRFCRRL